jgi:hypothetical protein
MSEVGKTVSRAILHLSASGGSTWVGGGAGVGRWGVCDVAYSEGTEEDLRDESTCGTFPRDEQTVQMTAFRSFRFFKLTHGPLACFGALVPCIKPTSTPRPPLHRKEIETPYE